MSQLLDYVLHIDTYLLDFVSNYGMWTYLALFVVIFSETGLVVAPFLPGDSLLFAVGSLAAHPDSSLNIFVLFCLLIPAAVLGNQVNYFIGRLIGPRVFTAKDSWFFNKKHLEKAHQFYEKNGGKTIILARFIPIIRTFAPFVAGVSCMRLHHFTIYNLVSAVLWVGSLLGAGYYLGSIPIIKDNFSIVIYAIIAFSLTPPLFAFIYGWLRKK